jgi:hypothetical protein
MKYFYSTLVTLLSLFTLNTHAAWDIWQSYVVIDRGTGNEFYAGGKNADGSTQWETTAAPFYSNLGRYTSTGTLTLKGGETKTFKNGGSDVCEGELYYRVYRNCDAPGSFSMITLPFSANLGGGDQRWQTLSATANLLNGLTQSGTYVVEVYWRQKGHNSVAGACSEFAFDSASGNNFKAYFEFNTNDSFTDFDISTSPVWAGDVSAYTVVNTSDAAGLLASDLNRSRTLRLNAPAVAGTESISTNIPTWDSQQEWYFWTGRRNQAATASNNTAIWLYSNESNLESLTVDGYRLVIGDDSGDDEIRLERVTNGVSTVLFTSTAGITNGIVNWGLAVKVVRTQSGRWTISTSTLPTASGTGATARSCVQTLATNVLTNSLNSQNYADDNTIIPNSPGFFGLAVVHSTAADAMVGVEFDNFRFVPVPPDTFVSFTGSSANVNEDVVGGIYNLSLSIANNPSTTATTVQVALTAGDAARIGNYTTQTVTFPAGSNAPQILAITITDNNLCDDLGILDFTLQNVSGGTNAYISTPNTFRLTVVDDNSGYETIMTDNFEDGNINGWTAVNGGSYQASNSAPASGTYSLRHVNTGAAGQAHVYYNTDGAVISGVTTTWRFNVKTYNREPSPANKWQVFLAANESNLFGASVDGYALGVNPNVSGDLDILTLWRVVNGAMSTPIITTTLDWGITQNKVGFEVVLDENGLWTLNMDSDGDFDNLVSQGTGTDITYDEMTFFGARFIHTASVGGDFALDDLSISQQGCRYIYYSRNSGNVTDAIWSTQPSGAPAPSTIIPNRYTRLVVQGGHTVDANTNWSIDDITIDATGVLNGGSASLRVHGNWINSGTFNAQTGTVVLRANELQNIMGSSTSRFNNLTIDNDFGTVASLTATEVVGNLSLQEGTYQTNGNLTLVSDATASGYIGPINQTAGASITGNVTIQRYLPAAQQNWVYLACPVPGRTIADWNDDIVTSGFANSDFPGYNFNNIYSYNETVSGSRNNGWVAAANTTDALNPQRGYIVYMTGAANTVDVTGSVQTGNISIPLSYTSSGDLGDGWNLVSNVYPAPVDWVALEANSADLGSYYVFDSELPGYRSYNANVNFGSAGRYIAHSQAFFVQTTGTNQFLNFQETQKVSSQVGFERDGEESAFIRLRIERNGQADEAGIVFADGATDAFDQSMDAEKWESTVTTSPEFALVASDNRQVSIDSRPLLTAGLVIPMYLDLPAAGTYIIKNTESQNLPLGVCVSIEDTFTGEVFAFEAGAEISLTANAAYQGNRMNVRFSAPAAITSADATCFGQNNGAIQVATTEGVWNNVVSDEMGAPVADASALAAGNYQVSVQNTEELCGATVVSVSINEPAEVLSEVASTVASCNLTNDGTIAINVQNAESFVYTITGTQSQMSGESTEVSALVESLNADVYEVTVSHACGSQTFNVDLRDENAVTALASASSTSLQIVEGTSGTITFGVEAPNANHFAWTINGVAAGGDMTFDQVFTTAGTYNVVVNAANDYCSATSEVTVTVETVVSVADLAASNTVDIISTINGLQVTFNGLNAAQSEVRIYNTAGQLVKQEKGNTQRMLIDMNGMSQGVYSVQVLDQGKMIATQSVVR